MKLKDFIPPILARMGTRLRSDQYGWSGDFSSWAEACKLAEGYDSMEILNRVSRSLAQVKAGTAVYERDAVLFSEIQYSWPALAGLMWSAARHNGQLHVMDFGGSLGSSYFQNRKFLEAIPDVAWGVVEQADFVKEGKSKFEDQALKFYADMKSCINELHPQVFLFSCVLQYLESPYALLRQALAFEPELVIVDHMPFTEGKQRLTVQRVPPQIYPASYPCWILNKAEFISVFMTDYEMTSGFKSELAIRLDGNTLPYEGMIFRRKTNP